MDVMLDIVDLTSLIKWCDVIKSGCDVICSTFARFCADFKIPHTPHRNAVAVNAAQKMAKSKPNAPSGVTAKRMRQRVA